MIQIAAFSIILAMLGILLKKYSPLSAAVISVAGCIILFLFAADSFSSIIATLGDLSASFGYISTYVRLMIKALGICIIAQIVVDMCLDAGEQAVASMVELCAKIIIIVMILPLFETLINIISGIVQ